MKSRLIQLLTIPGVVMVPFSAWAQENVAAQETTVTGGTLMIAAYLALWFLLLVYLLVLARKQSRLDDDIDALEKRLDQILDVPDTES